MKQITLEKSKGKTLVDVAEAYSNILLIFEDELYVSMGVDPKEMIDPNYTEWVTDIFNIDDMVRLGFITPRV